MYQGASGPEFQVIGESKTVAIGGPLATGRKLSADGMVMTASGKTWKKQDVLPPAAAVRNAVAAAVTHRAYASVQISRDAMGRMLLPISVAGVSAQYLVDTGSGKSLIGLSEAMRLGLKIETRSITFADLGGGRSEGHVAIVPALSVGDMRLRNVPLWVVDDGMLGVQGVIGIDLLLAFQTVRWNAAGQFELGFPEHELDRQQANLDFDGATPVVEVKSGGQRLSFVVDTGDPTSDLFPRFAAAFPELIEGHPQLAVFDIAGFRGRSRATGVILPEVRLRVGGLETRLSPAPLLLQKPPLWHPWHHGAIGLDVLNQARSVTWDFQAMRLMLE